MEDEEMQTMRRDGHELRATGISKAIDVTETMKANSRTTDGVQRSSCQPPD
jgi:hypothetical protein